MAAWQASGLSFTTRISEETWAAHTAYLAEHPTRKAAQAAMDQERQKDAALRVNLSLIHI